MAGTPKKRDFASGEQHYLAVGASGSDKSTLIYHVLDSVPMALERELLESAERPASAVDSESLMRTLARSTDLGEEQHRAAWHLTVVTGGLAAGSGMAGTGKTRMLDTPFRIWEEPEYEVLGAALAARAGRDGNIRDVCRVRRQRRPVSEGDGKKLTEDDGPYFCQARRPV